MDYALQTSKSSDDLPVSTTDIYSEAVKIFELKHNAASEYRKKEIPEKFSASHLVESTLDKLSELAAELLLQSKPIFEEIEMKGKFHVEEIEKLKESGLLHCGPPFRKSLLETTKYLSFTHLTVQEYLAARWFVMLNVNPKNVSATVLQFMAGILSKKKNGELMEKLLESISSSSSRHHLLLRAKCLSEYNDKVFAKSVIRNHPHHYSQKSELFFTSLNDMDCIAISFLLDVFSALNEEEATTAQHQTPEQSFNVSRFRICKSSLTLSGLNRLCESLEKEHCPVTQLNISFVPLTDEDVDCISGLVRNKFTRLSMRNNDITDTAVASLCDALTHTSSKVATLGLGGNQITDTGVTTLCGTLTHPSCKVATLDLGGNQITDTGVTSLCDALMHPSCKVTALDLGGNQVTDTGVASLCDALKHPSCKVSTLDLSFTQITDTGLTSLCDALPHLSCKVTTLYLSDNQITDTGVTTLCNVLTQPRCKVTTLNLRDNQITDTGVASLCAALTHPSCKVTTLNLSDNQITHTGVTSLCEAIQRNNCKLVALDLTRNRSISKESEQSLRNLVKQHGPGFKLKI